MVKKKKNSETKRTKKKEKINTRKLSKSCPRYIISLEKNKAKKIIIKKKKLVPLKDLFIKPYKDIKEMTIEQIKEFASEFDLNPEINYLLLKHLKDKSPKDYQLYIEKYKYTLNFQDAIKLDCFSKQEIAQIDEFENNIKKFRLNIQKIKNIESLSKRKLFNFLFFLMDVNLSEIENVYLKIQNYSNPVTLLFKVPNRFGNIEIKYYTLLTFFINFLILEISQNCSNNNNNIIQDEENEIDLNSTYDDQIYFNFYQKKQGTTIKVDLTEFFQRKNELDKSLEKFAINEEKKEFNKKSNKKPINNLYNKLKDNINRFRIFKERIVEMIYESDELIIKKIKFIYYGILFPKEGSLDLLSKYNICLNTNKKKETVYIEKYAKKDDNIAYDNLDGKYQDSLNNPFNYNACYYKFPTLLKKI